MHGLFQTVHKLSIIAILIHQKANAPAIQAKDRNVIGNGFAQRMQHFAITAQDHHHIRICQCGLSIAGLQCLQTRFCIFMVRGGEM